jgi:hypothetical protein
MASTKDLFDAVREEIKNDKSNEPMQTALALLAVRMVEQFVSDVHRIAESIEKIAEGLD